MFSFVKSVKKTVKYFGLIGALTFCAEHVSAEGPPPASSMSNPYVITLVIIMVILALAIGLLANVLLGAAFVHSEKEKQEDAAGAEKKSPVSGVLSTVVILISLLLLGTPSQAQDKTAVASAVSEGIPASSFYMMASVIFLEVIVILVLLYNLRLMLNIQARKKKSVASAVELKPRISLWDRLNKFRPLEQEVDIDLGHNYDGIRELDNRLPPWWLYGFYCSILFACIYLWRFHIAHTAPLSGEEFQIAMNEAAIQKEEYLKKAAANIDESNVKMMTAESDLAAGKNIYQTVCLACHGMSGEGLVGPNLTDDYWLHGGSINDVFKTIKYGWPEKGMKSWKDDYSPSQIAQIASYIKSLRGTNPPNPKAPQGTIDSEDPLPSPAKRDSTGTDSTKGVATK